MRSQAALGNTISGASGHAPLIDFLGLIVLVPMAVALVLQCVNAVGADNRPATDGLVLWLDAAEDASVTRDSAGRVSRWADRSGAGSHAHERRLAYNLGTASGPSAGSQHWFSTGGQFLNLGQPKSLGFRPGEPFTVAVISNLRGSDSGTFLAKGGGLPDSERISSTRRRVG